MSGRGGFSIVRTIAAAEEYVDHLRTELAHDMERIVTEAAEEQIQLNIDAHTKTGEARAAAGGNGPGRIDTGEMVNDIDSEVDVDDNEIVGRWGFLRGNQDYYLAQEEGHLNIPPVDAFPQTFDRASDRLDASIDRAGRR